MIQKIHYYFSSNNFMSDMKESLEEIKQDARIYIKENNNPCHIFRVENSIVVDKHGDLIYNSRITLREFNAEAEVNEDV